MIKLIQDTAGTSSVNANKEAPVAYTNMRIPTSRGSFKLGAIYWHENPATTEILEHLREHPEDISAIMSELVTFDFVVPNSEENITAESASTFLAKLKKAGK